MKHTKLFEDYISEKNFQVVIGDQAPKFTLMHKSGSGQIVALASTSKELDKLIDSGASETAIAKDIEDGINEALKKSRESFRVEWDPGYRGAGYAFNMDVSELLKILNK